MVAPIRVKTWSQSRGLACIGKLEAAHKGANSKWEHREGVAAV